MGAGFGFAQTELGPTRDNFDLVSSVLSQRLRDVQRSGHPINQRQHVHGKRRL